MSQLATPIGVADAKNARCRPHIFPHRKITVLRGKTHAGETEFLGDRSSPDRHQRSFRPDLLATAQANHHFLVAHFHIFNFLAEVKLYASSPPFGIAPSGQNLPHFLTKIRIHFGQDPWPFFHHVDLDAQGLHQAGKLHSNHSPTNNQQGGG